MRDTLKTLFGQWIDRLGLAWWEITVNYYSDPAEIVRRFHQDEDRTVAAITLADWQYGIATIDVNLTAFDGMSPEAVEKIVIHELCHILVNEMREGELHHEERVVTGLTKAFLWATSAARKMDCPLTATTGRACTRATSDELPGLIEQLRSCRFECEAGALENNVAFRRLVELCGAMPSD